MLLLGAKQAVEATDGILVKALYIGGYNGSVLDIADCVTTRCLNPTAMSHCCDCGWFSFVLVPALIAFGD